MDLDAWGVIGTWFGGLATMGAALIALYIARRSERIKLGCYVGLRVPVGIHQHEDFIGVGVTNLKPRPVNVTQIWWSLGRWWHIGPWEKKRVMFIIPIFSPLSPSQTPKELKDGDQALFLTAITGKEGHQFISAIRGNSVRTLRVIINTSSGYSKKIKPEDGLLEKLEELATADRANR